MISAADSRFFVLSRCLLAALLFAVLCGCEKQQTLQFSGSVMGTSYHVTVPPPYPDFDVQIVEADIADALTAVDELMSTYREDSELSRFNRAPLNQWFPVSAVTAGLVSDALELGRLTGGAFDITVGPVVDLWGFGPADTTAELPASESIANALNMIGYQAVEVDIESSALRKSAARRLDLSAIAKGYAVDAVSDLLSEKDVRNFLVEVGGEVRTRGVNPTGKRWLIGIEQPDRPPGTAVDAIAIGDAAVATSGDYRNYRLIDGRRYSHTIDPVTGMPVDHGLASVTVVETSAARADALATGLLVMGTSRALEFALKQGIAVYLVERRDNGYHTTYSPAFARHIYGN